jgi:hypothetical protein
MRSAVLVVMLVLVAFSVAGCEVVQGIFKAGVWVGVVGVALVLGIIAFIATRVRGS